MSAVPTTTVMASEIRETPAVLERLLRDGRADLHDAAAAIRRARPRWVTLVARGTSDHAATYARYLVETELGHPCGLAAPSVTTLYRAKFDWRDVLVVAVSQSGRSPDVVAVVREARRGGALTIAIVNDTSSDLAASADVVVDCRAGTERAVAATKSYVASVVAVAAIVAELRPRGGLGSGLGILPAEVASAIEAADEWLARSGVVEAFSAVDRAVVIARGLNQATALETALKLTEAAGILTVGYSAADFEHGPVAIVRSGLPVIAFRPDGPTGDRMGTAMDRIRRGGAAVWTVGGRAANAEAGRRGVALVTGLPEALTPAAYVVAGQLLAEAVAKARGLDPDSPAGLSKVTRTR